MEISEKIKKIREHFSFNQKEFAEKIGITQAAVSRYEKKERIPDIIFLQNLIDKFRINPIWIFDIQCSKMFQSENICLQAQNIAIQAQKQAELQALLQDFIAINSAISVLFKIVEKIRGQTLIQKILNVGFGPAGRQMRILYLMFLHLQGQNIQIGSSAKLELINAMQNFEIPKDQKINKFWSIRQEDKDSLVELIEKELDDASAAEIILNLPPLVEEMRKILGPIDSSVADKLI